MSKWDVSKSAEEVQEDIARLCDEFDSRDERRGFHIRSKALCEDDDSGVKITKPVDIVLGVAVVGVLASMWFSAK